LYKLFNQDANQENGLADDVDTKNIGKQTEEKIKKKYGV